MGACFVQEEQRVFTGRVLQIQEEERLRLARELHDDPLQQLMYLARTLEEIGEDPLLAERLVYLVGKGRMIARSASTAVRTLILGLRPPMLDDQFAPRPRNHDPGFNTHPMAVPDETAGESVRTRRTPQSPMLR